MLKIKNHEGLVKDPHTNTVINVNSNEYNNFVKHRNKLKKEMKEKEELERRVNDLENKIEEILSMFSDS